MHQDEKMVVRTLDLVREPYINNLRNPSLKLLVCQYSVQRSKNDPVDEIEKLRCPVFLKHFRICFFLTKKFNPEGVDTGIQNTYQMFIVYKIGQCQRSDQFILSQDWSKNLSLTWYFESTSFEVTLSFKTPQQKIYVIPDSPGSFGVYSIRYTAQKAC